MTVLVVSRDKHKWLVDGYVEHELELDSFVFLYDPEKLPEKPEKGEHKNKKIFELYDVSGIPDTFFIDEKGIIKEHTHGFGEDDKKGLKDLINKTFFE
jgi:hypothetical protein